MTQTHRQSVATKRYPAALTVRDRLRALSKALNRTVRAKRLSATTLHDLRVGCRRAEASLRLCREVADSRAWRWLREHIRELRSSCNAVRDDDVLRSWLKQNAAETSRTWRHELKRHRKKAVPLIMARVKRLTDDHRLDRQLATVVKRLQADEATNSMALVFGRSLFDELHRFVRSFPGGSGDAAKLHELRIHGKRLRYASEVVAEIWPKVELSKLSEQLHELQQQAGAIHDQQVGRQRLESMSRKSSPRAARELFATLSDSLAKAEQSFEAWWKTAPLERTLADTNAEMLTLMKTDHEPMLNS